MAELPPGLRFYPTEEELVSFYLRKKLEGRRQELDRVIPVLDIYNFNPGDLPQYSGELCRRDPEQWFFFIPRQEKEARGGRPNRLTISGYWKATGSPGDVYSSDNRVIGMKRTMVFYEGRAPSGRKTEWKMNEYKAVRGEATSSTNASPQLWQEFSLCRVYKKTKCVRAFDRRPQRAATVYSAPIGQTQVEEATTSSHQSTPLVQERRGESSPESSSSGARSQTGESSNADKWEMSVDNEPLWEWEQLNWF